MAEPPRKPPREDPVAPDIRPDLGGGETSGKKPGLPRDDLRSAEENGADNPEASAGEAPAGGRASGSQAGSSLGGGQAAGRQDEPEEEAENDEKNSGYYNPNGDKRGFLSRWRQRRNNNSGGGLYGFIKRNKKFVALGVAASGGVVSLLIFIFTGAYSLVDFMKNVEASGFQRYQVDLNGRSTAWLQAYMELRFGEVDDPNLAPKDRDNLFFRADKVKGNGPLINWYRTLRVSSFEQDLFDKEGIRFTSIAYKEGNSIRFKTGVISFKNTDQQITFDPGQKTFDAMARGDPNAFNGALSDFVNVDKQFDTDKEARAAIKQIVNANYPNWWKAIKRYHLRQDIQSMIGVRSWKFFENTRNAISEKKIDIRNKIITSALPEDSKTGAFIKCFFGIPDCKASEDPANRAQDEAPAPDGTNKEGDKTDGNAKNPQPVGDGSGEATIEAGSDEAAATATDTAGAEAAGVATKQILNDIKGPAALLSLLDSLARFDQALHNHTLSKIITEAKSQQVAGLFTVFSVAADQLTTGQVTSSSEINSFMTQFSNPTNSEGWADVIDPGVANASSVSAEATNFTEAKNKQEYCSPAHQAQIEEPQFRQQAENEFQYLCPQDQVGGDSNGAELENAWDNGPGLILHPFLAAFHAATGGLFNVFNSVTGAVTGPLVNATLSALGLSHDVNQIAASSAEAALNYAGGNINIDDNTPSGQVGNDVIQGAAVMNEASMRDQGAAATTTATADLADQNDLAYQAEQEHTSFTNRYLSLSNPKSMLSTGMFAVSTMRFGGLGHDLVGYFGDILSSPLKLMSLPAHAATPDGYAAAKFAGISTFDFPAQCMDSNPLTVTPEDDTNAVSLGIFTPSELNWDMMSNSQTWYTALYAKVGDNEALAEKVWNCALLDNTVRGGISAQYGYAGEDAYTGSSSGSTAPAPAPTTPSPTAPTGDAQSLAKQILDQASQGKIKFDHEWDADGDAADGSAPEQNFQELSQGQPAKTTSNCAGRGAQPPNPTTDVNTDLLKFILELSQAQDIQINALAGECHSETSSNHYKGLAVDFGCPFDPTNANKIGAKYNISDQTGETCTSGAGHYHYSIGGH